MSQVEMIARKLHGKESAFVFFKLAGGRQDIIGTAGGFGHGHVDDHRELQSVHLQLASMGFWWLLEIIRAYW